MKLSPQHMSLINDYLSGKPISQIAIDSGKSRFTIHQNLRQKDVKAEIERRLAELGDRVVKFKLDAFDAAEFGLSRIAELSRSAISQELQRLASLDCVKIAGLMPRRRILVESNNTNGIDADTRDWLTQVLSEARANQASIVDADSGVS